MATQERLLKAAKTSGNGSKQLSGKEASAAIWGAAVGGNQAGSPNDHEGLDSALAKSLAESDVAGALAAKKFGIKLLGGLSVKPGGSKSAVPVPLPAIPKAKGGPPGSSDEELAAELAERWSPRCGFSFLSSGAPSPDASKRCRSLAPAGQACVQV